MAALGSFAKLAKKRGWIGSASSFATQDNVVGKEETRSRSPSRQPRRMVRRPASPRRATQRQSGITGGGPQVGMSSLGMITGQVHNPLFDEDGMLKPGAQPPPGMTVVPTFSALPGTHGQPATSTAIVKLGVVDLTTPRKMTQPYLDQSLQKGPVCINFVAGTCMNPKACGRRHPEDVQEVAHLLEILKRKPCKFGNSCQWRPRCVFRHPEDGPLPDQPGFMGSKGFTGFTGFTGLVPAAGSEPGLFQPPGAGERLMVWNGAQGTQPSPPAVTIAPQAAVEARQTEGSGAPLVSAASQQSLVEASTEAALAHEDRGEPPKEQKQQEESQDQQELEKHKSQIKEQQQEIERLRTMLSVVNGPPATSESQTKLRSTLDTEH